MASSATQRYTPQDFGIGRLFHAISDAAIVADAATGTIALLNASAERLFGYTSEQAIGRSLEILIPERLREEHRAGLARYNRTGRGPYIDSHEPIELPACRSDGGEITIELSLNPIENSTGTGRFALALIRDVTERARLMTELTESKTRLEAALHIERQTSDQLRRVSDVRNEFLAMVAHDLRSPTAVIGGFADALDRNWDRLSQEERARMLQLITKNTQRLAELITNVLQVTQMESPRFAITLGEVDITAISARIAAEQQGANVRVTVAAQHDLPRARADGARQEQILRNLVSNALKYSPADTPVSITITRVDDELHVSVSDRGMGIHPEDIQNLFQKFSRVRQADNHRVEGTGLGLFICKALVEAQGGRIWVESRPGQGSTFTYTVPIAEPG